MIDWKNLDTLGSYDELKKVKHVDLVSAMTGESGAERVKKYSVKMAEGLSYNFAAKEIDDDVLAALDKLAKEAQLSEKFEALYNGEVINTGEKRMVLHQLTRGQLGENSMLRSRTESQNLQRRFTQVRSQMRRARSSQQ